MALTTTDLVITVSMVFALIVINMVVVEAGLGSDEVAENEIPTLNLSSSGFDFAGDRPDRPIGPDQFRVTHNETGISSTVFLNQSTISAATGPVCTFQVTTGIGQVGGSTEGAIGDSEGDVVEITNGPWKVTGTLENTTFCTWRGEILESPGGGSGFLESFVGDVAKAISGVFAGLVWLGEVAIWIIQVIVTILFNVGGTLFDVAGFGIAILGWLFGTYNALISESSDWASLALTIPVIGLGYEFLKVTVTLIGASDWL